MLFLYCFSYIAVYCWQLRRFKHCPFISTVQTEFQIYQIRIGVGTIYLNPFATSVSLKTVEKMTHIHVTGSERVKLSCQTFGSELVHPIVCRLEKKWSNMRHVCIVYISCFFGISLSQLWKDIKFITFYFFIDSSNKSSSST